MRRELVGDAAPFDGAARVFLGAVGGMGGAGRGADRSGPIIDSFRPGRSLIPDRSRHATHASCDLCHLSRAAQGE